MSEPTMQQRDQGRWWERGEVHPLGAPARGFRYSDPSAPTFREWSSSHNAYRSRLETYQWHLEHGAPLGPNDVTGRTEPIQHPPNARGETAATGVYGNLIGYWGNGDIRPIPGFNLPPGNITPNTTRGLQQQFGTRWMEGEAEYFRTNLPSHVKEWDEYQLAYQKQVFPELKVGNSHAITIEYDNPANLISVDILNEIMLKHSEFEELGDNAKKNEIYNLYEKLHQNIFLLVTLMGIVLISIIWFIKPAINSVKQFCKDCGKIINTQGQYCHHCGGTV